MDGETLALFLGLTLTAVVIFSFIFVFIKIMKSAKEKERMEEYKRRSAEREQSGIIDDEQRKKEESKQKLLQKYGLVNRTTVADVNDEKHQKHVEDSHEHGHLGQEEHYEEIIGSLGEVNDEGCADLSGVRFLMNDLAYDLQEQQSVDYDRIAQAMVLGDIINNPRFKSPYSRHK